MTEYQLLLKDGLVLALLDGRKTQTRRPMKPQPGTDGSWRYADGRWYVHQGYPVGHVLVPCTHGEVGDVLWLREAWAPLEICYDAETGIADDYAECDAETVRKHRNSKHYTVVYRATGDWEPSVEDRGFHWRPSIHMPRWACRATLPIVRVRAEQVQDITKADAYAEGIGDPDGECCAGIHGGCDACENCDPVFWFARLWDSIYAADGLGWDANPWVWVIEWEPYKGQEAT